MYITETMLELYNIEELPEGPFPISLKLIDHYQREYHLLTKNIYAQNMPKGSFSRGWDTIELVTYKEKIVIPHKLQNYTVKWYHTYLLHTVLYQIKVMIRQHLYWPGIREAVQR